MNSNPLNSSIPTTNSSESDVNVINSSTTRRAKCSSGTETTASNRAEMTAIEEQNSSSLTTKPLEQRAMTSDAIRELFDRNPPTKNLLCLKKQNIGDADVTALVPKLRENNSSGWYLPENHIGDTGVTELAKLLSSKWNLTFLNLSNNPISDKGAEELAEKLSENITLEILWLKNTQITHKGLTAFVNLLSTNNRTLSALSISSDTINVAKKSDPKIIDDITQLKQLLRRNKDSNFLLNSLKGYLLNSPEIDYLTKGKRLCSMPNFHEVIMLLRHNLNRLTDQIDPLRKGNSVPEQTQPTMLDILLKRRQEIIGYSKEIIQALETVFTDPNEEARLLNANGAHVMQDIKTSLRDLKEEVETAFEGNIGFILSKYKKGCYNTLLSSTDKFQCVHEILDMWEASFGEKSCPTWLATSQELATLNNFLSVLKGDKIAPFPTPSAEVLFTSLSNLIEQLTTEQSTDTSSPEKKKRKEG